jgi:hypothetical protein
MKMGPFSALLAERMAVPASLEPTAPSCEPSAPSCCCVDVCAADTRSETRPRVELRGPAWAAERSTLAVLARVWGATDRLEAPIPTLVVADVCSIASLQVVCSWGAPARGEMQEIQASPEQAFWIRRCYETMRSNVRRCTAK